MASARTNSKLPPSAGYLMFRYFRHGANKVLLSEAERRNLANIKASLRNANDDGFVGGETGVSPRHLEAARVWLQALVDKYRLQPVK